MEFMAGKDGSSEPPFYFCVIAEEFSAAADKEA
jgi:hypothetical protein